MAIAPIARIERFVDLRRRIHRVIEFIDDNLDEEHSLDQLAEIACISPFHFHLVYSRIVGRSPVATIRHLRLQRAAVALNHDGTSVANAALAAGYSCSQSFARAYRREFGHSPTARRVAAGGASARQDAPISFSIVKRPPQRLDVIMYDGIRFQADGLVIDAQAYAQLFGRGSCDIMSVYFDDLFTPANLHIRCAFGIHAEQRPALSRHMPVSTLDLEGGYYACVRHRGRLLDLAPHWRHFLHHRLPASGWVARPGEVLRQFVSDRAITPLSQRLGYLYVPVGPWINH